MMKLRQALEDLIATPVTHCVKKAANNSISNRTKRKEMALEKHKSLHCRIMEIESATIS